jgi:hypothetical protein
MDSSYNPNELERRDEEYLRTLEQDLMGDEIRTRMYTRVVHYLREDIATLTKERIALRKEIDALRVTSGNE